MYMQSIRLPGGTIHWKLKYIVLKEWSRELKDPSFFLFSSLHHLLAFFCPTHSVYTPWKIFPLVFVSLRYFTSFVSLLLPMIDCILSTLGLLNCKFLLETRWKKIFKNNIEKKVNFIFYGNSIFQYLMVKLKKFSRDVNVDNFF